jgi:hypothetical protein
VETSFKKGGKEMKISQQVKRLYKEKNKRLVRFGWCADCSDSGCNNPEKHELKLMQFAYELGLKESANKKNRGGKRNDL